MGQNIGRLTIRPDPIPQPLLATSLVHIASLIRAKDKSERKRVCRNSDRPPDTGHQCKSLIGELDATRVMPGYER
jgi:hypothetical protein